MTIRKSIRVARSAGDAFRLFTAGIDGWWPLHEGYSHGGERADQIHLECRAGGRFFERFKDGEELTIGTVLVWDPPARVVFSWKSPAWDAPTEVDVRFTPDGDGTRVELEHRGWEGAGPAAAGTAKRFDGGWDTVLARYAAA